ncbi:MAG: LptF/LptG family permease [Candidatus Omnitrophota bacterium]
MNIIDRHLIRSFLGPFIVCILTFSSMVIVIDLFNRLDEILKLRPPILLLLSFYLHFIPFTFVQTSPVALLVSCLYSVGVLNKHHEITAMRAGGLSLFRIITPFLFVGILVGAVSFIVNETVVPASMAKIGFIKEEQLEFKKTSPKENILKNIALFSEEGDLYYAASYDAQRKILHDLVVIRDNARHIPIFKVQAREGRWTENRWKLLHGSRYRLDAYGKIAGQPIFFVEEPFPSSVKPDDFLRAKTRGEMMSLSELRAYLKKLEKRASPSVIRRLQVEFHKKLAFPLANPITILIGFPFVFREKRAAGMLRGIGLSAVLCFAFYTTFVITNNLGVQGLLWPGAAVWSTNLLYGMVGIASLWRAR